MYLTVGAKKLLAIHCTLSHIRVDSAYFTVTVTTDVHAQQGMTDTHRQTDKYETRKIPR